MFMYWVGSGFFFLMTVYSAIKSNRYMEKEKEEETKNPPGTEAVTDIAPPVSWLWFLISVACMAAGMVCLCLATKSH